MGLVGFEEPFTKLFAQGMILGPDGDKMSKSRGNVVSPQAIVDQFGADTARCYILFIGPPDADAAWSESGVGAMHRFLGRLWRTCAEAAELPDGNGSRGPDDDRLLRKAHWAISEVSAVFDSGRFAFNVGIARVMELLNECGPEKRGDAAPDTVRFALATACSLLFPFAPHVAADGFERLTGRRVWEEPWPVADPALLARETFELVLQVNGKVRDRVAAPSGADRTELLALAHASANVQSHTTGKDLVKEVVVPGKLVNIVVR
jgi:leucyl-tRNA synthetase